MITRPRHAVGRTVSIRAPCEGSDSTYCKQLIQKCLGCAAREPAARHPENE